MFSTLQRALLTSAVWLLLFQWVGAEALREEPYRVWLDENNRISRSGSLGEVLNWIIVQDGEVLLQRNAANELNYSYDNNQSGHEYFAYLQKWGGKYYVRVSNIVGYRYGLDSDAPIITSERAVVAVVNEPFSYVIQATGEANTFTAQNLPAGLVLDERGVISGTPTQVGNFDIIITAANGQNVGTSSLVLSVVSGVNDGGATDRHTLVLHSNYAVTWNQVPDETVLNMVVQRNGSTVLQRNVLGKTHDGYYDNLGADTFSVYLQSVGAAGYERVSNIVYYQPGTDAGFPLITSSQSAFGKLGEPFGGYRIVGQNFPTSFSAIGLPNGLTVSSDGYISGVPAESGTFRVTMVATNEVGTDRKTLTLTIEDASTSNEFIKLVLDAQGVVRRGPGSLPSLCWVVTEDGVETLRRVAANEYAMSYYRANVVNGYTVHLEAWLNGAYRKVSNTVGNNLPALAFVGGNHVLFRVGQRISDYTILLSEPYDTLTIGELPDGIVRDGARLFGTPTAAGIYNVALHATGEAGSASATLTIEVLPASSVEVPADTYVLRVDANHTITRSAGIWDGLTWVVIKDGETVLRRFAKGETTYTYHRNFISGDFTVYLEAKIDGRPVRVSNVVGYRTPTDNGAPVFASPRRLQLIAGRSFTYQLLASGEPTSFLCGDLPAGVTFTGTGELSGAPIVAGDYPVTFTALSGGLAGARQIVLTVAPAAVGSSYADRYRLSCDDDLVVYRSPGSDSNLTWVVSRDGAECYSVQANSALNYRYHRNFDPGAYAVHLEALIDGAYRVVSNTVGYTVASDGGHELLTYGLGAANASTITYQTPELSVVKTDDGSPALCLKYSVNLSDGAVKVTLEGSDDLVHWTETAPTRNIVGGDETFELREDIVPLTTGAQKFHRVKVERQ